MPGRLSYSCVVFAVNREDRGLMTERRRLLRTVATIAGVAALVLASAAVAGVRYGHFHGSVGNGINEQHVDLFVSAGLVRISYVLRVHCSDYSDRRLGDFSGIAMTLRKNGDFSFKRALNGSFRQIAGNASGSKATVLIHVVNMVLGVRCQGMTTFHAHFIHA